MTTKPPRHVYRDDGTRDVWGHGRCQECGTPRSNERHEVPERSDEERETEARRVGEGGEDG
jgi:hypothetical protein